MQGNDTRVLAPTYRRYAIISNNSTGCTLDTSAALNVTFSPWAGGGTAGITPTTTNASVCSGDLVSLSFSYSGSIQKWVYRDNETGNWMDFSQTTNSASAYQYPNVTVPTSREYRALIVRQGTCMIDTTNAATVQINPSVYGNVSATPTVNTQNVCAGSSVGLSAPVVGGSNITKWIYRDNNNDAWKDFPYITANANLQDPNTNTATGFTRYYRAIFLNSTACRYDTTEEASATVTPSTQGYISVVNATASALTLCTSPDASTSITIGLSGSLPSGYISTKTWIYNDDNTGWQFGATSASNSYQLTVYSVSSTVNRQYAVVVLNSNTCSYDTTGSVNVTIRPYTTNYATNITPTTSSAAICAASINPYISVNNPSGYTMGKWMYQDNGGEWVDFPYSATSTTLYDYITNVAVNTVRNYRAVLNNTNACSIDSTNIVSIALNAKQNGLVNAPVNTSRTTLCYGKPANIEAHFPSGYTTPVSWIYSDNGGEWRVLAASSPYSNYTDNNTYVATTTSRVYRAILTNNTTCSNDTSNALSVTINPRGTAVNGNNITTNATASICSGSNVSLNVTPSTGNTVTRWIFSDDGTNWFDVLNSANSYATHYNTYVLAPTSRIYKAVTTDTAGCDFDTTKAAITTINPMTAGYDTTYVMSGLDSVCVGTSVSLNIPSGSYNVQKWQFSDNNGAWVDFPSTSRSITHTNTQVPAGTARTYRVVIFKSATCSNDTTTKNKTVNFKSKTYGNNSTAQANVTVDTVCSGNSVNLSISGAVESWLYKDGTNGTWTAIPNSASSFITHVATVVTPTWRYYRAVAASNNCQGDSTKIDSVFVKFLTQGNVAITPTRNSSDPVCYGSSYTVNVNTNGGTVSQWLYRTNGGIWQVWSITTATSITDYNTYVSTPTTREFRAIIFRNCSYDTTNALSVPINPFGAGNSSATPNVASNTICTGSPVQNLSVSGTVIQWLTQTGNGAWQVWMNGNNNNLSDYNTYVGTQTVRRYRAIVRNAATCSNDTTNAASVTINPIVLGNSSREPVVNQSSVCTGTSFSVQMAVASDTTVKGWLTNMDDGAWNINQTQGNLNVSGNYYSTTTKLGYRAVLYKASNCHIDTSEATYVTVNPRTYGSDNSIDAKVDNATSATACTGTSFNVSVNAGSGNSVQKWIYQDNGTGNGISYNTTSNNYSQIINTTTAYSRTYRALIIKGSTCTIDTTNAATISVNPYAYGSDNAIKVNVSPNDVCVGGTINVGTSSLGSGNSIYNWRVQNNGGAWTSLGSASSFSQTASASVTTSRTYQALVLKPLACRIDTAADSTITINPKIYENSGTVAAPTTTSGSNVCIGTAINASINMSGLSSILRWIYSDNGGAWNVINSSNSNITDYNVYPASAVSREYRAIVTKTGVCSFDTSAALTISISPRTYGTVSINPVAGSSSVCAGSSTTISVSGLGSSTVERWLVSEDNGDSWSVFSNSTLTTINVANSNVSVSTTRLYRALIRSASACSYDTTNATSVTFNPNGKGTQSSIIPQASKTSICVGNSVLLSVSGFTGSSVSQWLYRDDASSPWTVVNQPSTSFTDYNTNLANNATRYYRAIVNNSTNCSYDTTGAASVTINTISNGNAAVAPTTQNSVSTYCSGNAVRVSISPAGYTVQSWLVNTNGGAWTVLSNTSASSVYDYNTTVTSQTAKSYRAMLRSSSACSLDTSAVVNVTINPIGAGNSTIQPTTNTPSVCSGTTMQASVSASQVISWLYRDTVASTWSVYSSSSSSIFITAPAVSYPRTRAFRAIVYNTVNCSYDTTEEVTVQINPNTSGNAPSIAPASANTVYCTGNPVSATLTGLIGTVQYWIYRDNNGAWITLSGNASMTHNATTVTAFTTREYRALVSTGCNTDTTATLTVTIDVMPEKPSISNPTGTDSLICSEDAASYVWYKGGVVISGATAKVYMPTESGSYQVEVANASSCKTLSDVLIHYMTGLTSVELDAALKLYPNPTKDGNIMIEMSSTNIKNVKVVVMDMIGKVVAETNSALNNGAIQIQLGEHATAGVYFVTIQAEGATITKRVMYSK